MTIPNPVILGRWTVTYLSRASGQRLPIHVNAGYESREDAEARAAELNAMNLTSTRDYRVEDRFSPR